MADGAAYDVFVALHVTSAVIGFGAVALSGVYGGGARHPDSETAAEEVRRYFRAPRRAELALLVVPVFGAAAIAVGPGGGAFGEAWVDVGLGLWLVAAALLLGIVRPAGAVLRRASLAAEASGGAEVPGGPCTPGSAGAPGGPDPGGSDPALPASGRRLLWASAASDLIFVVALVIMVIKPGS
ncbi:MAG: hypothetical protein FWC87_03125 [Acidimicrobiaceae bacterium]|nr:hypothetical protein [Acidimicrobiaceae bacterium]